jgi:hypothetical protein
MFDPIAHKPTADVASQIVWFDAYVTNVDRTARNPNLLMWHRRLWLIDHGATLYFHHSAGWQADAARAREPFARIRDHVLAHRATTLAQIDAAMAALVTPELIAAIVSQIPDTWLADDPSGTTADESRAAYARYLRARVAEPRAFVEEAARAR